MLRSPIRSGPLVVIFALSAVARADIPAELKADHEKLPPNARHMIKAMMDKLGWVERFVQKNDAERATSELAEAEGFFRQAVKDAGPDARANHPVLHQFEALLAKAREDLAAGLENATREIETRTCPPGRHRDAALHRALHAALLDTFDRKDCSGRALPSSVQACKELKEALGAYGLAGKTESKTALNGTTTERVAVTACVRQERAGQKPVCRAFDLGVNRTRPRGGAWSDWKVSGVGNSVEIGCKHVARN